MYRRTRRYPELPPSIVKKDADGKEVLDLQELKSRWAELIRELNNRDVEPVPPADIYGRNYNVEPVFVTAGTSIGNPNPPTPGFWYRYTYEIPADAGLVLVQPVSISSAANVQILNTLPPASFSEGRTITIAFDSLSPVSGYGLFNMAVAPTSGSGDVLVRPAGGTISINNSVNGFISVNTTVATGLNGIGGAPIPSSAGGPLRLVVVTSGGVLSGNVGGVDTGSGLFYSAENSFTNNTQTSVAANITVSSTASYEGPLNYTFRAFGNKWVQIV